VHPQLAEMQRRQGRETLPSQRPRPSSSGTRQKELILLEKEVTQAEGLGEDGGGAGNLNETSRLRVIPLISHEGPRRREEAMIADLWHDPAMKNELPFTLCVLCELCELCG
jgi:hypothetical protein